MWFKRQLFKAFFRKKLEMWFKRQLFKHFLEKN
jgi:hypothetical protein